MDSAQFLNRLRARAPPRRVPSHPQLVLARSESYVPSESIFSVLSRSAQSDVGVLPATRSVFGVPRLVVADLSARPALVGREWSVFLML